MSEIKEIADAYEALNKRAADYWKNVLEPRVAACTSKAEFEALQTEVSMEASSDSLRIRDLPADISVSFAIAYSYWLTIPSK